MRRRRRHSRALERDLERDLARLADGTIEPGRRDQMERSVAASDELQARLREQRMAVAAVRTLASQRAPATLRMRRRVLARAMGPHASAQRRPWLSRKRSPALGLGLAGVLVAVVSVLVALGGSQAGLTVADAATLAVRPATAKVAEPPDDGTTLPHVRGAGLPFPYWEDRFGWVATGVRHDDLDGRLLTTVTYRRDGHDIAYTIVPGASLPPSHGVRTIRRGGLVIGAFTTTGRRLVVIWLRRGHTCVLSGAGVPLGALVKLAAWRGHGTLPY
ncbi:MAG TPA: hypothetical protein VMA76_07525 [Solirubrobacteraceae bacterium]|nr:hypothetical protein [Solirubrobacteraceae bacterium]